MSKLRISSDGENWRLKCPMGHAAIAPTNHHWWCRTCANHWDDVDPEYDAIVDSKTGDELTRDDVVMDFDVPGVHHA